MIEIRDWNTHFETAESRKVKKLSWVAVKIKLHGAGYLGLTEQKDGAAMFGCFIGIVEAAGMQDNRGTLNHSMKSLAKLINMPQSLLEKTVKTLSFPPFDWIITDESPGNLLAISRQSPGMPVPTVQDITEQDRTKTNTTRKRVRVSDVDAERIYAIYSEKVRSGASEDAKRNISKLLKSGMTTEQLSDTIDNYVNSHRFNTDEQMRFQANNFFGRAAHYVDFLKPVQAPAKPENPDEWHDPDL